MKRNAAILWSLVFVLPLFLVGCGRTPLQKDPSSTSLSPLPTVSPSALGFDYKTPDLYYSPTPTPTAVPQGTAQGTKWSCDSNGRYEPVAGTRYFTSVFSATGPDLATACALATYLSFTAMEKSIDCGTAASAGRFTSFDSGYVAMFYGNIPQDLGATNWSNGRCQAYFYNAKQVQ